MWWCVSWAKLTTVSYLQISVKRWLIYPITNSFLRLWLGLIQPFPTKYASIDITYNMSFVEAIYKAYYLTVTMYYRLNLIQTELWNT